MGPRAICVYVYLRARALWSVGRACILTFCFRVFSNDNSQSIYIDEKVHGERERKKVCKMGFPCLLKENLKVRLLVTTHVRGFSDSYHVYSY